jgi:hypothetical protein
MTIDGYLDIRDGKRSLKYIAGSIGLCHSFLPGALALQAALWIDQIVRRTVLARRGRSLRRFFRPFAVSLVFTLPWAIWLKIGGQNLNLNVELIKQHFWQHYLYIHKFIVPFFFVGVLAFRRVRKSIRNDPNALLFLIIVAVNLSLFTVNHPYFFRYLVPLIPLVAYLVALVLTSLSFPVALIAAVFIIHMSWRTFPGYLYEITHPYVGTNEKIVAWLSSLTNESGRGDTRRGAPQPGTPTWVDAGLPSGRTPIVVANYDDFTFRFHTPLTVYGAQHLPSLTTCPDIVIVFPEWGNEDQLRQISETCSLARQNQMIPFAKLADDPSPVTHQFSPPTTESIEIYYTTGL